MGDVQTLSAWPSLPYEEWRETRDTLHMYTQVIGKLRLALSPFEPEWTPAPKTDVGIGVLHRLYRIC